MEESVKSVELCCCCWNCVEGMFLAGGLGVLPFMHPLQCQMLWPGRHRTETLFLYSPVYCHPAVLAP